MLIQETHSTPVIEKLWQSEWGGKAIFAHGTTNARGIALFTSQTIFKNMSNILVDLEGRYLIVDWTENGKLVTLVAIYAPNEDNPVFFENISKLLQTRSENKVIVGDFNLTLDVDLDRKNTYCNNNRARQEVLNIMDQYFLRDIWRIRNECTREYSWFKKSQNGERKASRIDLALVSGGLDQFTEAVFYISSIMTDHRAVYLVLDLHQQERGTGYWKLNTALLQRQDFIDTIHKEITYTIELNGHKSARMRWEDLKERVKKTTIRYSRQLGSEEKLILSQLSERVNEYESRLPLCESEDKVYEETKNELEEKQLERIQGVMFRCKANWFEYGEKSSKYFFALEKARYNQKTCYKIVDKNGNEIVNSEDILRAQKEFYEDLYKLDQDVNFTLSNTYGLSVPEDIVSLQELPLSTNQLQEALKTMNNNKTPGEDGLPVEFYKIFWPQIKSLFYDMVSETYTEGMLHSSARKGILNLIPKPGKDSRYIKNLRPITLLNVDYKIIEKAIANLMIPALEYIIHKDQRGFMKNRRISVNIRKMLDIIHSAESQDLEAVVMSLDFVKCFDKCSFSILHGSLDFFGFGKTVKDWTRILYKDFTVKVQNNGYFSDHIGIHKGVHQGGCCSSIYFLVIAEILALSLRHNESIDGITIADIRNLLNQFADDMDIFSLCNEKSLKAIHSELEDFRMQSGFTVSYDKTTIYRIGSLRHTDAQLYSLDQFIWSNKDINVLGVTIAHEDLVEKNYSKIVGKARNILEAWYNRGLSLIGKVQIVNTLVASLFVYKMMVLPSIPEKVVKNVDNLIRDFLWSGKKAKIALPTLQNPKNQGGLNLVNLKKKEIALKSPWPQILYEEEDYASIVYSLLKASTLREDIWRCTLLPEDVKKLKVKSEFWANVLEAWCHFNFLHDSRVENQLIWYNSNIRVRNKPFFWADIYRRGLTYVHQLFVDGGFKTDVQMQNEFGLNTLRYNTLKVAIPKKFVDFFKLNQQAAFLPLAPHNYDMCIQVWGNNFSRKVSRFLADDITLIHNKWVKWEQELGSPLGEDIYHYTSSFNRLYSVTNIPKFRSFQFRLLHRALVTNVHLHRWSIKESDLCTFCKHEKETLTHLFVTCKEVSMLWEKVTKYLVSRYPGVTLEINAHNIINNAITPGKGDVINFVVLLTKQFIYAQKCLGGDIHFPYLMQKIRMVEQIEKYIAVKNGKLAIHNRKWSRKKEEISVSDVIHEFLVS